jgi:hypothetical protein
VKLTFAHHHHRTTLKINNRPNTSTCYVKIIANSSYALRNMGNYSQHGNMIIISGIKGTTQSEIIILHQIKTSAQSQAWIVTLKQYLEIDNSQTTRGSKWIMVMESPPTTLRRRGGEVGGDFPLLWGSGAAGSDPSGRGHRLRRCRDLDKSREK